MSGYTSFASGGAIANLNTTYETVGVTSSGTGSLITAGSPANTKGTYVQLSASTSSAWSGFYVLATAANSSGTRYLIDISTGAGGAETVVIPDIYIMPGTAGSGVQALFFPINIPSGTRVAARCQASGASSTVQVAIIGEVSVAGSRPMYSSTELLAAADTANTRASSVSVTTVSTAGTGWTQVVSSTARQYGALVTNLGATSVAPVNSQTLNLRLATGAAASEVLFWSSLHSNTSANPLTGRIPNTPIYRTTASSTRVSMEILAGVAGDAFHPQVYGCY
jgi:hypothetical protein